MIAGQHHPGEVAGGLRGVGVVVTRPLAQARRLCALIEAAGGISIKFPVVEICDPRNTQALSAAIDGLDSYDLAIFVSANAVIRTMMLVRGRRRLPANLKVAAIGRGTARELARLGAPTDIYPRTRFDSEAMLELAEMRAVAGKRIVIFRGNGGRELLGQTLRQRGATVDHVEAYRRVCPKVDAGELTRMRAREPVDVFTAASSESLDNLIEIAGASERSWLREMPLVVIGKRTVDRAVHLGFRKPVLLADEASDLGIVEKLIEWRAR